MMTCLSTLTQCHGLTANVSNLAHIFRRFSSENNETIFLAETSQRNYLCEASEGHGYG